MLYLSVLLLVEFLIIHRMLPNMQVALVVGVAVWSVFFQQSENAVILCDSSVSVMVDCNAGAESY